MDQDPYVRSILKALRILDIFGFDDPQDGGFSLGELSRRTGIAPNTLCKILKTMVRAEYLTQDAGHRYHSSHKTSMIHMVSAPHFEISDKVAAIIQSLSDDLAITAYFTTLSFGERKTILQTTFGSDHKNVIRNDATTDRFIYTKPTGRILVSYANSGQLNDILARWGFPGKHWDNIGDLPQLVRQREQLRQQGYCAILESNDLTAIAVPVKVERHSFLGALGTAKVIRENYRQQVDSLVASLQDCAARIAAAMS